MIKRYPIIKQVSEREYMLVETVTYYLYSISLHIEIKRGFVYDGASIPRFFWRVIGSPFTGNYTIPSLIHDALYRSRISTRKQCDLVFYDMMIRWGCSKTLALTIFCAVRACGWMAYNGYPQEQVDKDRALISLID